MMDDFRDELMESCINAGLIVLPRDRMHKLMAYVYVLGGSNEEVVFNRKLHSHILYSQRALKFAGTGTPAPEDVIAVQKYVKELAPNGMLAAPHRTEWIDELEQEYDFRTAGFSELESIQ